MRALVICQIPDELAAYLSSDEIVCRPELMTADIAELETALRHVRPSVIITGRELPVSLLRAWPDAADRSPRAVVRVASECAESSAGESLPTMEAPPAENSPLPGISLFRVRSAGQTEDAIYRALAVAERFRQECLHSWPVPVSGARATGGAPGAGDGQSVLLVGAGVVNLVTARLLVSQGFRVTVLDSGPDPRAGRSWTEYGCSRGGGNARMFTLTEMDDYHAKGPSDTNSNTVLDRAPAELGWDVRRDIGRPVQDDWWVKDFKRVPGWLARAYNRDIFGLNRRSGDLWQTWKRTDPALFDQVCLREDILRLYQEPAHLEAGIERQRQVGAMLSCYTAEQIREQFPALAEASEEVLAGGVLVRGFTVNVHDFMGRLLDSVEADGALLRFGLRAEGVLRDDRGRVTGILTPEGLLSSDHYVLSPGVYGTALLQDTPAAGQIHGVLGVWATIANLEPRLTHSLKVARRGHVAEDANVTVGRDETGSEVLMIGSGYGWTGMDPDNIDEGKLETVHAAVADTVRRLFPRAYDSVGGAESLRPTQKHCVRPWTASNLGLFERIPATSGCLVITGGHNTGGFAQAPVIAEAVLDALTGRSHPMHTLYHPLRTERALGIDTLTVSV